MSINLIVNLLSPLVTLAVLILPVFFISKGFKWATRKRKSPLSGDLLRSPGQSLAEKIEETSTDLIGLLFAIPLLIFPLLTSFLLQIVFMPEVNLLFTTWVTIIMIVGGTVYLAVAAYRQFHHRNKLRLGYECEVATGQGLNELLRYGFNVYHDFPADGFNIDHIAIGPTGVFAIEVKGRVNRLIQRDRTTN